MRLNKFGHILEWLWPEEAALAVITSAHLEKRKQLLPSEYQLLTRINWTKCIQLSVKNSLHVILYEYLFDLSSSGRYTIPTFVLKQLLFLKIQTEKEEKRHFRQSLQIIKAIQSAHFNHFVVMKTYFSKLYFGSPHFYKKTSDLDILVPAQHFNSLARILNVRGYVYIPNVFEKKVQRAFKDLPISQIKTQETFKKGNHTIELHVTLVDDYVSFVNNPLSKKDNRKLTNHFFDHQKNIKVSNISVPILDNENTLFSLFLHTFIQHNFENAVAFYEAAQVIHTLEIDWKKLFKQVEVYKLNKYFLFYLDILIYLFSVPLPRFVQKDLSYFRNRKNIWQKIYFQYKAYKLFHSTNYGHKANEDNNKKWHWGIINEQFYWILFKQLRLC